MTNWKTRCDDQGNWRESKVCDICSTTQTRVWYSSPDDEYAWICEDCHAMTAIRKAQVSE